MELASKDKGKAQDELVQQPSKKLKVSNSELSSSQNPPQQRKSTTFRLKLPPELINKHFPPQSPDKPT